MLCKLLRLAAVELWPHSRRACKRERERSELALVIVASLSGIFWSSRALSRMILSCSQRECSADLAGSLHGVVASADQEAHMVPPDGLKFHGCKLVEWDRGVLQPGHHVWLTSCSL